MPRKTTHTSDPSVRGKGEPDREPMTKLASSVVLDDVVESPLIVAPDADNEAARRFEEAEDRALTTGEVDEEPETAVGGPAQAAPALDDQSLQAQLIRSQILMAQAIEKMANSQPVTRVPYAKFKTRSPFNPTGNRKRKLTRRCYQNGFPVDVRKLFDEEIAMLNKVKPGRYMDGLVTIVQVQTGGNTDLHIVYKNKGFDDRLANKSAFRNFKELLSNCLDESAGQAESVVTV